MSNGRGRAGERPPQADSRKDGEQGKAKLTSRLAG